MLQLGNETFVSGNSRRNKLPRKRNNKYKIKPEFLKKLIFCYLFGLDEINGEFFTSASSVYCDRRFEFCPDTGVVVVKNDTRWLNAFKSESKF
jgi:hypothetical protein